MNFTAPAGKLAAALGLITATLDDKRASTIAVLGAVHIGANDGCVRFRTNVLDHAITTTAVATVDEPGAAALPGMRLAKLVAGVADDTDVTITANDTSATVAAGRGRYRLPLLPLDQLPPMPELDQELGSVELPRDTVLKLFTVPAFAVAAELTRYYLTGICLHDTENGVTAVATDGHRLARLVIPTTAKLSADRRLIVPRAGVKIITKLLAADKAAEKVILRRSRSLFQVETNRFSFVSKIIDADFPSYERLIPPISANHIECDRAELVQAIARLAAMADPTLKTAAVAAFEWTTGAEELRLSLARQPGAVDDAVAAATNGSGQIAMQICHIEELLDELEGERVTLNAGGLNVPVLAGDPANAALTVLQMPVVWKLERAAA